MKTISRTTSTFALLTPGVLCLGILAVITGASSSVQAGLSASPSMRSSHELPFTLRSSAHALRESVVFGPSAATANEPAANKDDKEEKEDEEDDIDLTYRPSEETFRLWEIERIMGDGNGGSGGSGGGGGGGGGPGTPPPLKSTGPTAGSCGVKGYCLGWRFPL